MHSRKKGRSGSHKPIKKTKKTWNIHSVSEVEKLIIKLAKTGKNAPLIGIILRDNYGIPDVKAITGKKISQILEKNKLQGNLPDDLLSLIKKDIRLTKHLATYKKDMTVKRGSQLTLSKIHRLAKYYKSTNKLPNNWVYERSKAKLLLE